MMYTLYNILLNFAFVLSFPYLLLRAAWGGHGIAERMGRLSRKKTESLLSKKVIWFHAASVGEVKALSTIIPQVKKDHPEYTLVVSTITKSGKKEAERILQGIKLVFFLPLDLKRFVRRALGAIKPEALFLVETELWPNLIREAKRKGCLVTLINGRISDSSLRQYLLAHNLFKETLSYIDLLCMQSEEHRERIIRLGANPDRIKITGNLKFDRLLYASKTIDKDKLKKKIGIPDNFKVIIGGSMRSGEEQILIDVFKRLKGENQSLLLILAPRHLDRLKEIERIITDRGMRFIQKSQLDDQTTLNNQIVILLDTMGELSQIYALTDVALVGGSLVPVGGHNLLEPAIYGVPVLFGPYIDHFKEEAKILIESGGGIKVKDEEELYLNLSRLLSDDQTRIKLGESAREAIQNQTGVSKRTTDLIFSLLENPRPPSAVGSPPQTSSLRLSRDIGPGTFHPWWLLSPFSWLYMVACDIRIFFYRCGVFHQKRLGAKVISVGNITVGGTGKTPLVIFLAEKLKEKNTKVAILSRGYRRKNKEMVDLAQKTYKKINWKDVGDEPCLMAQRLFNVPIVVSRKRSVSGQYAIEKYGTEVIILDDGFQHLQLHRDLDMVVIDSTNPFGNGKLLPAGRLRETLSSLKRADLFVLTKTDQATNLEELIVTLKKYNPKAPLVESIFQIRSLSRLFDSSSVNLKDVEAKKALAFSGIGNPSSFENSLKQLKIRILRHKIFSDHFPYRPKDIFTLQDEAKNRGADFMVTTEKDSVRIPLINNLEIPWYVVKIDLKITKGEEILFRRIEGKE